MYPSYKIHEPESVGLISVPQKGEGQQNSFHTSAPSFLTNVKKATNPISDVVNNMAPIGTADASLIPASGVNTEPNSNGSIPKTALALPARCPCLAIPSVKVLVIIIPIVVMYIKINMTMDSNGPLIIVITSRRDVAASAIVTAVWRSLFSGIIPPKRPIIKLPVIIASPLMPNNTLNVCGDTP